MNKTKLNVGCGRHPFPPEEGWFNLDISPLPGIDFVCDLNKDEINLPSNTIEEVYCSHLIEHIEKPLWMMEELHKVCKSNARATILCPYGSSDNAFEDPQHIKQYFLNSFYYFSQLAYHNADYGYRGDWMVDSIILDLEAKKYKGIEPDKMLEIIHSHRNVVKQMTARLICVKPIREPNPNVTTTTIIFNYID